MLQRYLGAAFLVLFTSAAAGQTRGAALRTPWGHPDLQGRWTNATITLLERPLEFGAKEYFTEAEAAEYSKTALERFLAGNNFTEEAALSGELFAASIRAVVPCAQPISAEVSAVDRASLRQGRLLFGKAALQEVTDIVR